MVITDIIDYIKKNKILLIVCAAFLAVVIMMGCILGAMKNKNKIANTNIKAATEEIQELRTQNGDLLVEKQSFVTSINELEEMLDISKKEVKSLQKTLNNKVLYISKLESEINVKPTEVHDTTIVYKDSTMRFTFSFKDDWYNLNGTSEIKGFQASTKINNLSMSVPLKVGMTDDWQIFVTTPNPYVSFTNVEGALLDKNVYLKQQKKRHWGFGVYLGFNAGYDLINKGIYAGPGVGIGGMYMF